MGRYNLRCAICSNLFDRDSNRDNPNRWSDEFGGILSQMGEHHQSPICNLCVDKAVICEMCDVYIPDHQHGQTQCQECADK